MAIKEIHVVAIYHLFHGPKYMPRKSGWYSKNNEEEGRERDDNHL